MEHRTYGRIDTVEGLTSVMRNEALKYGLGADSSSKDLRTAWNISNTIKHQQIEDALTATLRSDRSPMLVLTLCGGMIVASGEIGMAEGIRDDDLWELQKDLFDAYDGGVRLTKVADDATGYGVLIAYRMPFRDGLSYRAGDEKWIDRFGVEVGRYIQRRE